MKVDGIEISNNAKCTLIGWPYGTDLSRVARIHISTNGERPKVYHLSELASGLKDENALMGEVCSIKFIKKQNGEENEEGAMAEIVSGQFKGEIIFLKIKKEV